MMFTAQAEWYCDSMKMFSKFESHRLFPNDMLLFHGLISGALTYTWIYYFNSV